MSIQMSLSYQGTFGSCSFVPEIVCENEARQYQRWTTSGNHVTLLDHDRCCLEAEFHKNFHLIFPAILHLPPRSHEWVLTLRRYKLCILGYHREEILMNLRRKEICFTAEVFLEARYKRAAIMTCNVLIKA